MRVFRSRRSVGIENRAKKVSDPMVQDLGFYQRWSSKTEDAAAGGSGIDVEDAPVVPALEEGDDRAG